MQLVNVRTLKIVELLTFKAEDLVAHDHADMDAFAVEYIAVHDRRPLERPPQQRLRLLDGESETNRPQGYFPFAFTLAAKLLQKNSRRCSFEVPFQHRGSSLKFRWAAFGLFGGQVWGQTANNRM